MPMAEETYEYHVVSDRNLDPLAGSDKNSIKMLTDVMNTRHGKGWVYAGIVPLATLQTGEIQPQGCCYLFKTPQAQVSPKQKQGKRKK
jgi:hypothetical protein